MEAKPGTGPETENRAKISLSRMAYEGILDDIISGKLRMGQSITVDKLAEKYNISRTPIREAIISLELEEILERRGKFYFVIYPDANEIEQMYELRVELEAVSAYLAASRISPTMREELNEILNDMEVINRDNPKPVELANINGKFHGLISVASGNRYLEKTISMIRMRLRVVRITLFTSYENRLKELSQHRAIGEAIMNGSAEQARALMIKHERDVWKYVKKNVISKLLY